MLKKLRFLGALLLIATLCLPVSRCTWVANPIIGKSGPTSHDIPTTAVPAPPVAPDYLLSTPDSSQNIANDALIFASCSWPAVVILLSKKPSLFRWHRVFFSFEVIPVAYAGLTIATMGMFEKRLMGFYVGICGAILCALVWFTDVFMIIRGRLIRNHPLSNSQQVDS